MHALLLSLWLRVPEFLRLQTYKWLVKVGLRLYGHTSSTRCFRLPFDLYAKYGPDVHMAEANVMRYLAKFTSIPLPRVIDAISIPSGAFIIMTRVPGHKIAGSLRGMREDELLLLAGDLSKSFEQLRSLPPSAGGPRICGFGGGDFLDYRLHEERVGPFMTEEEFYEFFYTRIPADQAPRLREVAQEVQSKSHNICLTHNDITPHNVLVDERNRLTGIVDWECAAWMPDYWEYTRSHWLKHMYPEWLRLMDEAHGEVGGSRKWAKELAVEKAIWAHYSFV